MTVIYPSTALVNIAKEGDDWLEWAGALYESYAADHEVTDKSTMAYSRAAHRAAEDIEFRVYASQIGGKE